MEAGGSDTEDLSLYPLESDLSTDVGFNTLCENIVALAVMIAGADMGSMQLLDSATGTLKLRALHGFDSETIPYLSSMPSTAITPCVRALTQSKRIIVTDLLSSNVCDECSRSLLHFAGVMAMQATPIIGCDATVIGMISTYWRQPHQPSRHVLELMDRVAQQAAGRIEELRVARKTVSVDTLVSDLLREETAERLRLERELSDSEIHLQRVLQAGEVVSYEWDCDSDILICSSNCVDILDMDVSTVTAGGHTWEMRIHPEDRPRFREAIARLQGGCGRLVICYRYMRSDGSVMWLEDSCVGEYDGYGGLRRVCGLIRDVTARKRIEELQQLLMREFDHRARNMLATTQAMISLTARTQTQVNDFVIAVQSRIRSMARTHDLIASSRWTGASLRDLIECELEPYIADRPGIASIVGKDEILTPGATMAVAMALHELVTNAAKYGALSTAEGRVRLSFHRDDGGALVLEWSESGGPEVAPPRRRGFGSLLIESSMRTEVGGSAEVRYLRSGLVCIMVIPAVEILSREDAQTPEEIGVNDGVSAGVRILLVEYPAARALETRRRLEAFGYQVLGPADTLDDAVRLANTAEFDAAILDINFGERDVFPVLDILATRNVPIAFVTAYKLLELPPRYRDCLVLTKPLSRESVRRMFDADPNANPGAMPLRRLS